MIEVPWFTVIILTLAALMYVSKEFSRLVGDSIVSKVMRNNSALESLHKKTHKEIATEFDFWWSDGPLQSVKKVILKGMPPGSLPDEILENIHEIPPFSFMVAEYHDSALHLAIHARMVKAEKDILRKTPKVYGLRQKMIEQVEEHESELDSERINLLDAGIDVKELEKTFALSV